MQRPVAYNTVLPPMLKRASPRSLGAAQGVRLALITPATTRGNYAVLATVVLGESFRNG